MVYFTRIEPTDHYLLEHEQCVPWEKVIEIILSTKNPRKMDEKYRIETEGYYILFEVKNNIAFVINAKVLK